MWQDSRVISSENLKRKAYPEGMEAACKVMSGLHDLGGRLIFPFCVSWQSSL